MLVILILKLNYGIKFKNNIMKKSLNKFIKTNPAIVSIILLPVLLWCIIFLIEVAIGHFMPHQLTTIVAAISGVFIGIYVNDIKN